MIDSDNVLLLRLAHRTSGFSLNGNRPPPETQANQVGFVTATMYYFDVPVKSDFISYFENTIQPALMEADISVLAYFITEESPNTYPRLPVREGEHVFVWFAGFPNQAAYELHAAILDESQTWRNEISKYLKRRLKRKPELLKLAPNPRSRLTGSL